MSLISIPNTFTVGAVIIASQHNSNFSTIYSDYNGNITDANISASASITDTKLGQITTASKVSGAALTTLGSIPTGGGTIPTKNGGTGGDMSSATIGSDPYFSATGVMSALSSGTSGQVKMSSGAGAPTWANALSSVLDYGTSASLSTSRQATAIKVCYGQATQSAGSITITNLPFTSATSYVVTAIRQASGIGTYQSQALEIVTQSASSFQLYDNLSGTKVVQWQAIGT